MNSNKSNALVRGISLVWTRKIFIYFCFCSLNQHIYLLFYWKCFIWISIIYCLCVCLNNYFICIEQSTNQLILINVRVNIYLKVRQLIAKKKRKKKFKNRKHKSDHIEFEILMQMRGKREINSQFEFFQLLLW